MRHMRHHLPALALYVGVFLSCVMLAAVPACGEGQRQKTLHAAVISVNVARDGFLAFDKSYQIAIVDKATSREEGQAALDAYRAKREPVAKGFELAYKALALAATQTDDPSYRAALAAAEDIAKTVLELTGGP